MTCGVIRSFNLLSFTHPLTLSLSFLNQFFFERLYNFCLHISQRFPVNSQCIFVGPFRHILHMLLLHHVAPAKSYPWRISRNHGPNLGTLPRPAPRGLEQTHPKALSGEEIFFSCVQHPESTIIKDRERWIYNVFF